MHRFIAASFGDPNRVAAVVRVPRAAVRARIAERDAFHPQPIQIGYQAPAFYGFQAQAGARDVVAARA